MKILYAFLREARGMVTLAVIAAALSGAASTGVIILIHSMLDADLAQWPGALPLFVGICVLVVATQLLSEYLLLRLSEDTVYKLRTAMCRRILGTPLRKLEDLGQARLLATISGDLRSVAQAVTLSPLLCMYVAIIVTCMGYIAWLNWQVFAATILLFVLTMGIYQLASRKGESYFTDAREDFDTLYGALRGLTEGTKELKLNHHRRDAFLSELLDAPAVSVRDNSLYGHMTYRVAGIFGRISFLFVFGVLFFVVPLFFTVTPETMNGYVLALLYMNMPLTGLLNTLPNLGTARVAMRKIQQLGLELDPETEAVKALLPPKNPEPFQSVELRGVTHTYYREQEDETFTLGPVDLKVNPGEVLFLIGGNGSGKTTLAKILVGLYAPAEGEIRLNGHRVEEEDLETYRQHFAMVFSDFFLFQRLLGYGQVGLDERAQEYITKLHLDKKVKVVDGKLSTTELSQGQRKRLALLNAYLEDRPIYVFDEWAADQDPVFKKVFYEQLLPELRSRGKAVVVISHDDHYYDAADRIVKLNYGLMEPVEPLQLAAGAVAES